MNTRLMIELADIEWSHAALDHALKGSWSKGVSLIGDFYIVDTLKGCWSFKIDDYPDSVAIDDSDLKHKTLKAAKAACQRIYQNKILSSIVLRCEDFD